MNTRKYVLVLALLVMVSAAALLVTGAQVLVRPLFGNPNFPAGTMITWLGIIALPLTVYAAISSLYIPTTRTMRIYRRILLGILVLAAAWGLVSYLLAGNWRFSFSGSAPGFQGSAKASWYFWRYSFLAGVLPFVFLLVFGIHRLVVWIIAKTKRKK